MSFYGAVMNNQKNRGFMILVSPNLFSTKDINPGVCIAL